MRVRLWSSVLYAGPTFPLVAVIVIVRVSRSPAVTDAENVMSLEPGPDSSVLMCHGRNRKGLVGRLWFPADGTYVPLVRSHFGWGPAPIFWSAATKHVYLESLATVPDAELLALKRVRLRGTECLVPNA